MLEAILCGLIAPALTAGAISIEREQQTLDLLLLTRLSDVNILFGKLFSALSFIAMILICALPVVAISFLLGGVAPAQLCWATAIIFVSACFFSAIGLYCSTRYPKTATAVAVAYCICLAVLALLPLLGGATVEFLDTQATQTYFIYIAGASALVALYPTIVASALFVLIGRRSVHWLFALLCWIAFFGGVAWVLLLFPAQIQKAIADHPEFYWVGNPVWALWTLITGNPVGTATPPTVLLINFIPITVGVLLLAMLVMQMLTIGEFKRLRR